MDSSTERTRRRQVNDQLHALGTRYHNGLPLRDIDNILTGAGFSPLEEAIYCGREGRFTEQVGSRTWLLMTWYKMEVTGRYEVVAYVS